MTKWNTQNTYFFLFDVGRGFCSFLRLPLNIGILYDCGKSKDFNPLDFIKNNILPFLSKFKNYNLAQFLISHPHLDHIAGLKYVKENWNTAFYPRLLTCPHDKEPLEGYQDERLDWSRVNNPESDFSNEIIAIYKELYKDRNLPLQTIQYLENRYIPNLEYGLYYVRPPKCADIFPNNNLTDNQNYTNSTSLLLWYRHGKNTLLLPGDITPEAMRVILNEEEGIEKRFSKLQRSEAEKNPEWHRKTLDQPPLRNLLKEYGLSILVAPHHGLKSSYSEELYDAIKDNKPLLVLISEKRHSSQNDGEVCSVYQSLKGAKGLKVEIEGEIVERYSLSTRNGHHILVVFKSSGNPEVYAYKEPQKLIEIINKKYEKIVD